MQNASTVAFLVTSLQHITVLDDEVEITTLLANYLQAQGYRVTQVHTGDALMQVMASDTPALVLLDLGLPGEDGFTLARQLREAAMHRALELRCARFRWERAEAGV